MKEPWETLLGQYRDHWMLADHLARDVPNPREIQDDERWWSLSSGEQAMIAVVACLLRLNECYLAVDAANQMRIDLALRMALDA